MKFTLKLFFIGIVLFGFTHFSNPQTRGFVNYRNTENRLFTEENTMRVAEEEPATSSEETQTVKSQPSAQPSQPSALNPSVFEENTPEAAEEVNDNSQSNK